MLSHSVMLDSFGSPWVEAHKAPLFMGFPKQEYWSGLPFPSPGDLLHPGIKPRSPVLYVVSPRECSMCIGKNMYSDF